MRQNLKANLALVKSHPILALALLTLLAGSIVYVLIYTSVKYRMIAEPVQVAISTSQEGDRDSITIRAVAPRGAVSVIPREGSVWRLEETYVKTIRLVVPNRAVSDIQRIAITLGRKDFEFAGGDCFRDWTRSGGDSTVSIFDSPAQVRLGDSVIPLFASAINWPGDSYVLSTTMKRGITALLLSLCLIAITLPFVNWSADRIAPKTLLLLCIFFTAGYSVYYLSTTHYSDTVFAGWDQLEYQSLAVNFAKGHGLQIYGGVEPAETYRFADRVEDPEAYNRWLSFKEGFFSAYRSPGFPFVLGMVYKVFGVSPEKARQVSLFMLILVAGFLPFIGHAYWNLRGFYGGVVGGVLFLECYRLMPRLIMTEPLIILILFLLILLFLLYERRRNLSASVFLGVALGIALLVKGDLIFLPPLFVGAVLYQAWKRKSGYLHGITIALCCVLTVAPWSIYASLKSKQFVVVSTQGSWVLLTGNNEGVFEDGGWHPELSSDPGAFQNRADIRDLPAAMKVVRFYAHYADKIPLALHNKLRRGFDEFLFIKAALLLIAVSMVRKVAAEANWRRRLGLQGRWIWYTGIALLCLVVAGCLLSMSLTLLFSVIVIGLSAAVGKHASPDVPLSFTLIFLNFLLITIITFGEARFISVIDFLGILTSLSLALTLCIQISQARSDRATD